MIRSKAMPSQLLPAAGGGTAVTVRARPSLPSTGVHVVDSSYSGLRLHLAVGETLIVRLHGVAVGDPGGDSVLQVVASVGDSTPGYIDTEFHVVGKGQVDIVPVSSRICPPSPSCGDQAFSMIVVVDD